jgi:hypothetical protein
MADMTTNRAALVERVTDLIRDGRKRNAYSPDIATTAIDLIRAEVLEEAAGVADALEDALSDEWRKGLKCDSHLEGKSDGAGEVAAAIRALKGDTLSKSSS